MESSIIRPKWLTDEAIKELRSDIAKCPNPYTKEDVDNIELDGNYDPERLYAYEAIDTLTSYGIPLTDN